MKVGSCFSGVGMFDYGLQQAGYEIAWQIEWDEWCRRVLTKHWPDVPKYSDIKEVDANRLEPIDLLIGGYPCQPFSVAGKQQGQADDRHLWPEMFRIIQALRPTWVIGENVAGHISMGLDDVLSDLESEGYSCQAFVIPACAVNAPHRRDRVWVLAYSESRGQQEQQTGDNGGKQWGQAQERYGSRTSGGSQPGHTAARTQDSRGIAPKISRFVAHADSLRVERQEAEQQTAGIGRGSQGVLDYPYRQGPQRLRRKHEPLSKSTTRHTVAYKGDEGVGSAREPQPRLGRSLNGIADRLDQVRYPAALGQPQHEWEPPRVAQGIPDRVNRLKALGNGGMWQIPFIVGSFIKEVTKCST